MLILRKLKKHSGVPVLFYNSKDFTMPEELFNKLLKLNTIPHINRGGCGIVAHALYTALQKAEIKASIVYVIRPHRDQDIIEKLNNNEPTSCAHVLVKVGRYYYDTKGQHKSKKAIQEEFIGYIDLVKVDPEFAYKSAAEQNSWNRTFNRERYANAIPKLLGVKVKYHKPVTFIGRCRDLIP